MRTATSPKDTAPHTRGVSRDDRQVVALAISLVLLSMAAVAAIWTEAVPHHRGEALLVAGVSAIL
ncbi:MAG TPA: hypothetical protein VL687_04005, partial [Methylomirabilota bacterium]|nr:hypothetical protein [Methylomirabilota bacterium]